MPLVLKALSMKRPFVLRTFPNKCVQIWAAK